MTSETPSERALVLFSGGQDSTVCLAWALDRYSVVETVGFDYGQRHRVELACRQEVLSALRREFPAWDARLGVDHQIDLTLLSALNETSLTRAVEIALTEDGLPTTFVPGRNIMFLTIAAALAFRRNLGRIVGGMCETDFSGYPDCRDDSIKALQVALNLGMNRRFVLETPLMWLTKAETWGVSEKLGGEALVSVIRDLTHTCYLGDRSIRHVWGYGCGDCPACCLRAAGYRAWQGGLTSES
ncbi:7-cyano-7-deazaguanine synthase [Azospirillaceae bacterium]